MGIEACSQNSERCILSWWVHWLAVLWDSLYKNPWFFKLCRATSLSVFHIVPCYMSCEGWYLAQGINQMWFLNLGARWICIRTAGTDHAIMSFHKSEIYRVPHTIWLCRFPCREPFFMLNDCDYASISSWHSSSLFSLPKNPGYKILQETM